MRKSLLPLALLALVLGVTAYAQPQVAPPPRAGGGPVPAEGPDGPDGEPPLPPGVIGKKGGPGGPGGGSAETPRMTRLKQLTFDRRPSAVLKAWAPKPKDDKQPPPKDEKAAALDKEVAEFQKNVTLGKWAEVKAYVASLPDEEATAAYKQLLRSLQQPPGMGVLGPGGGPPMSGPVMVEEFDGPVMMGGPGGNPAMMQFGEKHAFSADDILGLAAAAPTATNPTAFPSRAALAGSAAVMARAPAGLTKEHLASLAAILREAVTGGTLPEVAVAKLKADTAKPEGQAVLTRRQVAKLLTNANLPEFAGDFLPSAEQAQKDADLEALNLLARHFLALHAKESKSGNLEKAWAAVQTILAVPGGSPEEKEEGLLRAVELAPRLKDELGQAWLDASFTKNPERGMEILSTLGTVVSRGLSTKPHATDERLNALKLTKTATDALLKVAPERAKEWRGTLTILAVGWLKEAEFSQRFDRSAGSGPRLRRDVYGNIFFGNEDDDPMARMMMMQQPNMPRPVPVADVLKAAPGAAWVAAVDDSFRPKLAGTVARLHLKANEEDKAFPLIEQLAPSQPQEAKELVKEFLRVWTRTHDPNAARNENRYSWFFFAFEQRAESIPLTRSKQERNLKELSGWAARIKKLPGGAGELDDEMMVKAFTACHSSAEVYRTEAIEAVFGPMGGLKPKTLAGLADQMRTNLAGLWKEPAEQQKKKTNRKKKDIEAEVLRGYAVAREVIEDGLKKFPNHWALLAAQAGIVHDEVNYRHELAKSSRFSTLRGEAFAVYRRAADDYAKAVLAMPEPEHTTNVYEQWFAASLGAVDLGMITEEKQPDWNQPPLIRAAILALPGDLAEKHMAKFANNLFIKMSGAKPHVKFNYLKAGFQIVGDHKQAAEAKKVFDYYKDLVTEIKLEAVIDGADRVGHGRPFGLFVNLRHTRDIERESGGFGRYLQNQNSMMYSYNYGRPTADYRDRFETAAREALKEHFEVVSVTFQDEKVNSRATPNEFGWRYTPYAYVLLRPRGPQVDKIPSLRLDLDFLDTSGFVVMPVESPAVPIDAKDKAGDTRPIEKLTVTQTLDERQADKGVLLLEVRASGVGLVPDLNELCGDLAPAGFDVTKTDDQGLGVKKFEEDAERNAIVSERTWTLTLKGKEGQAELPKTFRFAAVKVPAKEVIYQRYNDADLTAVAEEIALEKTYGKKGAISVWVWVGCGVFALALVIGVVFLLTRPKGPLVAPRVPSKLDAFTAAAILREIRERPELSVAQRAELDQQLAEIERYYFSADRNGTPAPDLRRVVERWVAAVPGWSPARSTATA
jgi:hypothetical protein